MTIEIELPLYCFFINAAYYFLLKRFLCIYFWQFVCLPMIRKTLELTKTEYTRYIHANLLHVTNRYSRQYWKWITFVKLSQIASTETYLCIPGCNISFMEKSCVHNKSIVFNCMITLLDSCKFQTHWMFRENNRPKIAHLVECYMYQAS